MSQKWRMEIGWGVWLLVVAGASAGLADPVASGVDYTLTEGYHIIDVDLTKGFEVRVNHPKQGGASVDFATMQNHALQENAIVSLNANYFDVAKGGTCGAARGFGEQFTSFYSESGCQSSLGWSHQGQASLFSCWGKEGDLGFHPEYSEMITGGGVLLFSGPEPTWNQLNMPTHRAMTAVGISADRSRMVLIVTDKLTSDVAKMKQAFQTRGVVDAIFLDGGSSSWLWIKDLGYVNIPERGEPSVPVAVLVVPSSTPQEPVQEDGGMEPDGGTEQDVASENDAEVGEPIVADEENLTPDIGSDSGGGEVVGCGCSLAATGVEEGLCIMGLLALAFFREGCRHRRKRR